MQQAAALRSFAMAYAATGDDKWRARAHEIDRYIEGFLLAPDGAFYSTQQDEAPGLPAKMTSTAYFALPDGERRKYGVPPVDHAVYTDQNGQAIEAYAILFEATGDETMLARATRAATALLTTRMQPAGFITQVAVSKDIAGDTRKRAFRPLPAPYLTAQAHFATALVALFRVTGDARWFEAARSIMNAARATLEDPKGGGFFATHVTRGPIELSVVGGSGDARATALYRAALRVYEPRKAVHYDVAGRYPDRGKPALYACTKSSCSSPIYDPAGVAAAVAGVADPNRATCP